MQAHPGEPNESVLVDDLREMVAGAVRMLHGISKTSEGVDGESAGASKAESITGEGSVGGHSRVPSVTPSTPTRGISPGSMGISPASRGLSPASRGMSPHGRGSSPMPSPQPLTGVGYAHRCAVYVTCGC